MLGFAAAVSAISLVAVSDRPTGSGYALACLVPLVVGIFLLLAYTRPLTTLLLALIFITSPIRLALTAQQSAAVSMFLLGGAAVGLILRTHWRAFTPDPMLVPVGLFTQRNGIASGVHGFLLGNPVANILGDCVQVVEFALVYFLVTQVLRSEASLHLLLRTLLISMLIMVMVELGLFTLGPTADGLLPSWQGGSSPELVRTIDIDATILFAVLITLYPLARSPRQRSLIWAALIPTVANIALSLSRGIWVCSLAAVLASLVLQGGKIRARLIKNFPHGRACAWCFWRQRGKSVPAATAA